MFEKKDLKDGNDGYQYYEYKKAEIPESPENLPLSRSCSDACDKKVFDNGKHKEFCLFVLQFLLYLVASNSDITENTVTKQTYRPSKTIKNKFSEIRKWDVGYRIGKSIRLSCSEVPEKDNEDEIENTVGRHRSSGYKLRPHYRRAHWQHYHVGPNRERIELRWKEPLFVNGTEKDIPAVVHKVLSPVKSE